ncbi:MAG: CxxC-x17-CxxC domain-containing protein [Nanoarchaeota archaeon]
MGSFKPRNKRTTDRSFSRFEDDRPKRFSRSVSRPMGREDRFERRDPSPSFEKNMFTAVCAKCGVRCEVPFKPTSGKPVFCSDCFRKNDDHGSERSAPSRSELGEINRKLDQIMKALDIR